MGKLLKNNKDLNLECKDFIKYSKNFYYNNKNSNTKKKILISQPNGEDITSKILINKNSIKDDRMIVLMK